MKKANVFVFTNTIDSGGAGRQAQLLSAELKEEGYGVTLVQIAASLQSTPSRDSLQSLCPVSLLPRLEYGSFNGFWNRLLVLWRFRRLVSKAQPDLIVAFLPFNILVSLIGSFGFATKLIAAERSYPPARLELEPSVFKKLTISLSYRLATLFADRFICQSEETQKWLQGISDKCPIDIIPNFLSIPLKVGSPVVQAPGRSSPKGIRYICVGRLVPSKRMDMVVRAFAENIKAFPMSELYILGNGSEYGNLENLIREMDLEGSVKLVGNVGNMTDWYKVMDVLVLTSRFEGFPNVLLEAIGHNLATISIDIKAGPKEITDNGRIGMLLPRDTNEKTLAKAMSLIANNPAVRRNYASHGKEIKTRYSAAVVMAQWKNVIQGVIRD